MKVALGITSSIAAYKVPLLIRALKKQGHEVRAVLTENAARFVTPEIVTLLTGNDVIVGNRYFLKTSSQHIEISKWADVLLIAPADYNIIGKVASGVADDIVSTLVAAFKGPVVFAPAMHDVMWENPVLQDRVRYLKEKGYYFSGPIEGDLYSGDKGKGRFHEIEFIIEDLYAAHNRAPLAEKKVLLVYGRTEEPIDDVRVITNRSSGKMGVAIAKEIKKHGGYLIQIAGKLSVEVYGRDEIVRVTTSEEMKNAVHDKIKESDILIMAAAVSDFKPENRLTGKLRREKTERLYISLKRTDDILKSLSDLKGEKVFVGFALSDDIETVAPLKLREKNLDILVANTISAMEGERSSGFILTKDGSKKAFSEIEKERLAHLIVQEILEVAE